MMCDKRCDITNSRETRYQSWRVEIAGGRSAANDATKILRESDSEFKTVKKLATSGHCWKFGPTKFAPRCGESDSETRSIEAQGVRSIFGSFSCLPRGRHRGFDAVQNAWQPQEIVRGAGCFGKS